MTTSELDGAEHRGAVAELQGGGVPRATPRRKRRGSAAFRYGTLAPLAVLLGVLFVYPLVELVHLALTKTGSGGTGLGGPAAGLSNFTAAFHDPTFQAAVVNNAWFIVGSSLLSTAFGVAIAMVAFYSRRLRRVAQVVLLWPAIIAPVAVGVLWWMIIDPQFGVLNDILKAVGLPTQGFLGSTHTALATLIVVDTWHWTPICFILAFAALQAIDTQLLEAARMDGASELGVVRRVLLPLLGPAIGAILVVRVLMGTKVFDEFYLLTGGGPGTATTVLSLDIRNVFFTQLDFGYGAALGVLVAAGLIVVAIVIWIFRRAWLQSRRRLVRGVAITRSRTVVRSAS